MREKLFNILPRKQMWGDCVRLQLMLSSILKFVVKIPSCDVVSLKLALAQEPGLVLCALRFGLLWILCLMEKKAFGLTSPANHLPTLELPYSV